MVQRKQPYLGQCIWKVCLWPFSTSTKGKTRSFSLVAIHKSRKFSNPNGQFRTPGMLQRSMVCSDFRKCFIWPAKLLCFLINCQHWKTWRVFIKFLASSFSLKCRKWHDPSSHPCPRESLALWWGMDHCLHSSIHSVNFPEPPVNVDFPPGIKALTWEVRERSLIRFSATKQLLGTMNHRQERKKQGEGHHFQGNTNFLHRKDKSFSTVTWVRETKPTHTAWTLRTAIKRNRNFGWKALSHVLWAGKKTGEWWGWVGKNVSSLCSFILPLSFGP